MDVSGQHASSHTGMDAPVSTIKDSETEVDSSKDLSDNLIPHEEPNPQKDGDEMEVDGTKASSCTDPQSNDINQFAYLDRDEFTSEIFKIEIMNLPPKFGVGQLRRKLFALNLKPGKLKVLPKGNFAFVNFRCEDDRQRAMEVLEGHMWKGNRIKVRKAQPAPDPLLKKRKMHAEKAVQGESNAKVSKVDFEPDRDLPLADRLNKAVSPLWQMPYEEQLQTKQNEVRSFLKNLTRQIQRNLQDIESSDFLRRQIKTHKGLCCELGNIQKSPVLNDYRNKCEFTIGQSIDGKDNTIGFRLGQYKGGSVRVVEPDDCVIVPGKVKECIKALQQFLQTQSSYKGFDRETKTGNWIMVVSRSNKQGDVMLIVVFHPQQLTKEDIAGEREKLLQYFTVGAGKDTPITSLYFQAMSDRHEIDQVIEYQHLNGEKQIEEDLLGLKFRISPGAFFQVNTAAAELLYSTVADWCNITSNTVLLDVCCGTGTIGLTMAKKVKKVIGIEMCKEAIDDARVNAKLNEVTNAEFYCSKAEDILPSLIGRFSREEVVAVVDPPRAGLHTDVIKAIRKSEHVTRLIYVSCKPTGALNNLVDLTRTTSNRVKGSPFKTIKAIAVDLFPHTSHSELVLLLERTPKNKAQTSDPPAKLAQKTDLIDGSSCVNEQSKMDSTCEKQSTNDDASNVEKQSCEKQSTNDDASNVEKQSCEKQSTNDEASNVEKQSCEKQSTNDEASNVEKQSCDKQSINDDASNVEKQSDAVGSNVIANDSSDFNK